jgi:ELWxxDGT repeat protein
MNDGAHGSELWVTDGTAAGTALYQDLEPGPGGAQSFSPLAAWGSSLLIAADDGIHGIEPFIIRHTPPTVRNATFDDGSPNHAIRIQFSDNLGPTLAKPAITVRNLTTGATIDPASIALSFDDVRNTAQITFPGLLAGTLPDGRYILTISGNTLDLLGDPLDGNSDGVGGDDYTFTFEHLAGDANHDGYVDDADQAILTNHLGQTGMTFAQGDFNGDGTVDAADQAILTGNWHFYLPADSALTLAGGGSYRLTPQPGGMLDVFAGASPTPVYRIPSGALTTLRIQGDTSVAISTPSRQLLRIPLLAITQNGRLDLGWNDLLTNTPAATIREQLKTGLGTNADCSGTGGGITSSLAAENPTAYTIGYADGNDPSAQDAGIALNPGETLLRPTLVGDANLDGTVNFFDVTQLLGYKYNTAQQSSYTDGDLNYDGIVDFFDLVVLLSANYNSGQVLPASASVWPSPPPLPLTTATASATPPKRVIDGLGESSSIYA